MPTSLAPLSLTPAPTPPAPPRPSADPAAREAALRETARDFEAAFLAEMLKHAGLGAPRETFSGGPGEEAFSSFLTRAYADKLSEAGGLGLAEHIFESLKSREGAHDR